MKPSPESKTAVHVRVMTWLGSSAFGLAGTVLLICWLLAYALEPEGGFARVGLFLAVTAYVIDLAREGRRSERERPHRPPQRWGGSRLLACAPVEGSPQRPHPQEPRMGPRWDR